ncbi:PA2169 family four-helix-bundle protein [Pedobacter sp. HMF7647]|uniref:PA2169 family four-helix-bundle protein n=1 Tax=Hufsiella arboris TaxID=2695275 RepID=A0A7K1YFE7_9SPHI|nr:PA2169 family four-helix-bundle protein [Hufsiella arboris]MXV53140.1 PA2169 family four-helix-bundle protein [Hufsiella arboris]
METTEKTVDVLNDLIEINNDRAAGFSKALADINDENIDLKALFQEYSEQSRKFSQELTALTATRGGDVETGHSVAGTLHRAWIDVKSLFGGSDRESILDEAERGEDAIKKAYQTALTEGNLTGEALSTVSAQSQDINQAHDAIKALRDTAK